MAESGANGKGTKKIIYRMQLSFDTLVFQENDTLIKCIKKKKSLNTNFDRQKYRNNEHLPIGITIKLR